MIIIGIMVGITLPSFTKSKERALGREANATLKLIAGAEKNYKLESVTSFYPSSGTESDIDNINSNLALSLVEKEWNYAITRDGCGSANCFNVTAARNTTDTYYSGCIYSLAYDADVTNNPEEPTRNDVGKCP